MKNYTVVGVCMCGCEQSFVEWCKAKNPDDAVTIVEKKRRTNGYDGKSIAVFNGHIGDMLITDRADHCDGGFNITT